MRINKFDNHVFLTICELSMECFKKTGFITYKRYAESLRTSIAEMDITKREMKDIISIANTIELIYGMSYKECVKYIEEFFHNEKYLIFEKSVMLTSDMFPLSKISILT